MEEQYNSIIKLKDKLKSATKFDEVTSIARELFFLKIDIDHTFNKFIETCNFMNEICNILMKYIAVAKSQHLHKQIIRTIIRMAVLAMNNRHVEQFDSNYLKEYGSVPATIMTIYGCLQNARPSRPFPYAVDAFHSSFVQASLKYSDDTKYFALAIENYTQAYDFKIVTENDPFTATVIITNLENGHQHIHKLLLELFRRVVLAATDNDIMDMVAEIAWNNRNRHYLLANIISVRPEMLLKHRSFNVSFFMNGLRIGLSQYHLYSSSLALVKAIYTRDEFRKALISLSAIILLRGDDYEVDNFLKLWFTTLDDKTKDDLFKIIAGSRDFINVSSTSTNFHRAVIIRNAFDRVLNPQLDRSINEFSCSIGNNVQLKIDVFNFLFSEIYKPKDLMCTLESILRLLKFLQCNMCVENSFFIDSVMRRMPNFFNHLATNRFRNVEVCREIFTIIRRDLYETGVNFGSYETSVFSLRLLEVILKQYCGTVKGKRLSKNTDKNINLKFKQYLRDNEIWDVTSLEIFHHLVKMANDTDNSDICTTANEMLVEYFIKTRSIDEIKLERGERFQSWINVRVCGLINSADVESYHQNISYWKMKFEYSGEGLMDAINDLQMRSAELKISKDPVSAMQRGRSLFPLIDCINYSLLKSEPIDAVMNILPAVIPLMKTIALQFLDFVNDGVTCPSFDVLDKNLRQLIETASWKCENIAEMKHKLLLSIFFTLRALSELSVTIARVMNGTTKPQENEHFTTLSSCLDVNVQILSRFCHKGVIEAAGSALGCITKIISAEFLQQCDRSSQAGRNLQTLLIELKHEIDCAKRHTSKTGEIRGSRGFVVMSHNIIKNHKAFLKFLMQKLLVTKELHSFYDTQEIKFASDVQPIHLHLLAALVKDSELVEEMLKYYNFILIATFKAYKESKDFIIQNALLQIIGNITPKIANHKRHTIDETEMPHYEAKAISVYEFYVKLTYAYRIALVDLETSSHNLPQTYIIILLEVFSNFEYRKPWEFWSEMPRPATSFAALMSHRCEKIRVLAAKCYAQWHLPEDLPKIIKKSISNIFSSDPNFAHGTIVAIRHMMERYEASVKCIKEFNKESFKKTVRDEVTKCAATLKVSSNFFLRCYLLEFLLPMGFQFGDNVIEMLMDETTSASKIGYTLWREKVKGHRIKTIKS